LLTTRQVDGTKLEIWLEQALRNLNYSCVRRNVEYYRDFGVYRQVDVEYKYIENNNIKHAIIEAKYSQGTKVPHLLRGGTKNKNGKQRNIETLIDEVLERKEFIGADIIILATNYYFEQQLIQQAQQIPNLHIIEQEELQTIYSELGGKGTFENSLENVRLNDYLLQKHVEILPHYKKVV
jgi:hypothetical protein